MEDRDDAPQQAMMQGKFTNEAGTPPPIGLQRRRVLLALANECAGRMAETAKDRRELRMIVNMIALLTDER